MMGGIRVCGVMTADIIHLTYTLCILLTIATAIIQRIAIIRPIYTLFTTAIHGIIRFTIIQAIIMAASDTIKLGKLKYRGINCQ